MSHLLFIHSFIFFFKQKTAYEMRISDWSSDMCSSDLRNDILITNGAAHGIFLALASLAGPDDVVLCEGVTDHGNRKRVVSGKSVAVRVDLGGRCNIKKENTTTRL